LRNAKPEKMPIEESAIAGDRENTLQKMSVKTSVHWVYIH
jgi:hypothetical protein